MIRKRIYIVFAILALIALVSSSTPAQETGRVCHESTAGGLGLTGAGQTRDGLTKCLYGPVESRVCPMHSVDGRLLVRTVIKPNGRVKCVYISEGTGQ